MPNFRRQRFVVEHGRGFLGATPQLCAKLLEPRAYHAAHVQPKLGRLQQPVLHQLLHIACEVLSSERERERERESSF